MQDKVDEYKAWIAELGLTHVEISDGAIEIPRERKLELIAEFARDFTVLSEVGSKDSDVDYAPDLWVAVDQGGARRGRLEGDHRGARGRHRRDLPADRRDAHRARRRDRRTRSSSTTLIFEAPTKASQAWFIKQFGPEVNLGNIPPDEVIPLETLRLGLRGDTLKEVLLGDRAGYLTSTSRPCRRRSCSAGRTASSARGSCLTCSWQKQSSVLVHMVSELGLDGRRDRARHAALLPGDLRDARPARRALRPDCSSPRSITVAEQHQREGPNLWERIPTAAATSARSSR